MLQRVYNCQLEHHGGAHVRFRDLKDLPATFPEEDKHKGPAAISSITIHIALVTALLLIPLVMPEHIQNSQLMRLVAPAAPPPPPPALPPTRLEVPAKVALAQIQPNIQPDPCSIIMPTEIPREIARVVDDAPLPEVGIAGGVFNGNVGGVLRSVLLTGTKTADVGPPPPSPPPPPPPPVMAALTPIHVGGEIKEPSVVKLISPVYPKLAIKARVTGTVILEATVTAEGTVDEIKVISGNPLLIEAAVDCVKQWRYEPTYLNGEPVPVILTARVHFELRPL